VLFYVLFVCKCVLPTGDNPTAVNIYHIISSIKLSLWTFQVQGLNIIETVISLYSSIAMICERFSLRVIRDTQSWRRKLSKFSAKISKDFLTLPNKCSTQVRWLPYTLVANICISIHGFYTFSTFILLIFISF